MPYKESDIATFVTVFGRDLLSELPNFVRPQILIVTMDDLWPLFQEQLPSDIQHYQVHSLEREALESDLEIASGVDSIVGLGGGQAIDVAKYFAWRLNLPLFQFPTSLSVDAVFGHRAGVREGGMVKYIGWAVPETVFIDLNIIESAPPVLNFGGVGDVFCFITGVMEWRYAHQHGKCEERWPYDDSLAVISLAKAEAALQQLHEIKAMSPKGIEIMVDALKWGGASYHGAGWNPRHIEGIEHYIFYALEAKTGKKFIHGQAVCLGIVFGAAMHEQRADELLNAIKELDVDIRPSAMGITWDDVFTTLRGLKTFVLTEKLAYGIAHEFNVTDSFLEKMQQKISEAYSV